jgi:acylphosphatase
MDDGAMVESNLVRVHLFISGQVQGVGFRAKTQRQAETLGVNGWAANLPDGRVEVVIEGEPALVEQLVDWCRSGPARATVTAVKIERESPKGEPSFFIRYI